MNEFQNLFGPNFSKYKDEGEEDASMLKRKYPKIEEDVRQELQELQEMDDTKRYLKKLEKRNARLRIKSKLYK